MMTDEDIARVLDKELENALTIDRSLDGGSRQMAVDYYTGALPENDTAQPRTLPAPAGGGSVPPADAAPDAVAPDPNRAAVSLDVADMTEAVVSQLLPALEAPGAIEFEALGPDDEADAQRESAIVRSIIMEGRAGEGGFVALTEAVKDALLMRTGVMALWVQKRETRTPEEWEAVPAEGVAELSQPSAQGQRIEGFSMERDEASELERKEAGGGEAGPDAMPLLYRIKLTRVDVDKRLVLAAVPRESYVTSNAMSRDANEARFCADRLLMSRTDWVAEGMPEDDIAALPAWEQPGDDSYVERSRVSGWTEFGTASAQRATDVVELWRCYAVLADEDGGVTGKRYRVFYSRPAKRVIGTPEVVGRVCYALGVTTIFPHRLEGVSLFDSIAEIQELKTKGLRAWTENLHKVNRPRLGVDENLVSLADALDATQDVIRMRGPNGLIPVPAIDQGPSVLAYLNYCDQARSERGGASLDMQSSAMQIASNQTATGIERQYSTKEARAAMMARTFAETGMRQVWLAAHYLLRTHWGGTIAAKVGGQWVDADPSKWRPRTGVVVHVGESRTQAGQRAGALQAVMTTQAGLMTAGKVGVLTDDAKAFNAIIDWCYANNLRVPERYFIDPSSPPAQQAAAQQRQAADQQRQVAASAAMAQLRATLMLDKYKVDQSSLTDLIRIMVDAAIEEAKLTLQPAPLEEAEQIAGQAAGKAQARSSELEQAVPGAAGGNGGAA